MSPYFNLLEPDALVRAFLRHAPTQFEALKAPGGTTRNPLRVGIRSHRCASVNRSINSATVSNAKKSGDQAWRR
jgi:hypothetical protein